MTTLPTLAIWISTVFLPAYVQDAPPQQTREQRQAEFQRKMDERAREHYIKNARQHGYISQPRTSYLMLPLPKPISKNELAHLADVLELSDAQMQQFDVLHEQYLDDGWAYRKTDVQPLYDQSAKLSNASNRNSPLWSDEVAALHDTCYDIRTMLHTYDNKLLEAMRPFLSDEQLQYLKRAYSLRQRQRDRQRIAAYMGARYDLSERLFELKQAGSDMSASDPELFNNLLRDYETQATTLFHAFDDHHCAIRSQTRALSSRMAELSQLVADGKKTRDEVLPEATVLQDQRLTLRDQAFGYEGRLHDLNNKYLHLLAEQLPDATAYELITWWREELYRYTWPDPFSLDYVFELAATLEQLNTDQQTVVNAAYIEYDNRRATLENLMKQKFTTWNKDVARKSGYDPADHETYAQEMMRVQNQRRDNAARTVDRLRAALTDDQFEHLQPAIDHYELCVQAFDECIERVQQRNSNWPGPYGMPRSYPRYPGKPGVKPVPPSPSSPGFIPPPPGP